MQPVDKIRCRNRDIRTRAKVIDYFMHLPSGTTSTPSKCGDSISEPRVTCAVHVANLVKEGILEKVLVGKVRGKYRRKTSVQVPTPVPEFMSIKKGSKFVLPS